MNTSLLPQAAIIYSYRYASIHIFIHSFKLSYLTSSVHQLLWERLINKQTSVEQLKMALTEVCIKLHRLVLPKSAGLGEALELVQP